MDTVSPTTPTEEYEPVKRMEHGLELLQFALVSILYDYIYSIHYVIGFSSLLPEQCEAPSTIRHANIAPSKQLHSQGGTIHYTCEVGYELNGSAERTCGANGVWIQEEPSCRCQSQASETGEKQLIKQANEFAFSN